MIPHSYPFLDDDTLQSIKKILDSRMLAQGKVVRKFESRITEYIGGHATACVGSGSAAILLGLKVLGVGPGDEVVLPTYVCSSVLEAVLASDATPVLCDVNDHWVVSSDTIAATLSRKTKAIIVPHVYGIVADVDEIRKLGIPILEDCAQAFGRTTHNAAIGVKGDLAVFSFHPTKCLTTGEGGALMLNKPMALRDRMFELRDGDASLYRRIFSPMSDIAAGIGLSQLNSYDHFLERRRSIAKQYDHALSDKSSVNIIDPLQTPTMYFRYVIKTSDAFDKYQYKFAQDGISVRRGIDALLHRKLNKHPSDYKNAEYLFDHTLSLPIYPALDDINLQKIIESVKTNIE